jgi:hypothetical protein
LPHYSPRRSSDETHFINCSPPDTSAQQMSRTADS